MSEHAEQVALMQWLALQHPDIYQHAYAIPNGGKRNITTALWLKAEGVKRGVPDICIAMPSRGYCGMYLELKDKVMRKGRLSDEQKEWLGRLKNAGYYACVAYGFDGGKHAIEYYLTGDKNG